MGVPLIVNTPPGKVPVTPPGKPVTVAPVALPPVEYVMLVIALFTQTVWLAVAAGEVSVSVAAGFTVMVPLDVAEPQPPVVVTV